MCVELILYFMLHILYVQEQNINTFKQVFKQIIEVPSDCYIKIIEIFFAKL